MNELKSMGWWDDWVTYETSDVATDLTATFYGVTMMKPLGSHIPGDRIYGMCIDLEAMTWRTWDRTSTIVDEGTFYVGK